MGTQPRRTDAMNERGLTLVGTQPPAAVDGAPRGWGVRWSLGSATQKALGLQLAPV